MFSQRVQTIPAPRLLSIRILITKIDRAHPEPVEATIPRHTHTVASRGTGNAGGISAMEVDAAV